ncbi:MAG TPA: AraC family transcriptional regulator [Candidatus Pseudogracilibacillus intestinigallinarum]|uniref:AraC family transcriptional regulator n=1 Tax=Candidatus Pseudogracilibacillus intestinigallinarum TaxID=2838742 RepID=A0A9D1TK85_9BACI|nr:AraC family transcriptional regulator [Candidatus Pseudogracilibacillus intestinigallinarum]
MQTRDITLNSLNEEIIPYREPAWLQIIEYMNISKTILGYIPLHWHEELQFTIVKRGTIELRILGEKIIIPEGSGFFINSGIVHEMHAKTENATYICWNIGISLFDKHIHHKYILPFIQETNTPFVILNRSNERHLRIIQAIDSSYDTYNKHENGYELIMTMQYLFCLHELLPEVTLHSNHSHPIYDHRVKIILEYIHTHFQEQIKLETLAELTHLSRAETIRIFKRHVGRTPFKYILDYRLERSIDLLIGTSSTITEVALDSGFTSVSYFIEKFKEGFHMTPRKYREKKAENL